MSKNKLLLLLALLLTAATGAWAQGPWTSGACTVTFSDGVMTVSGTGAMADYKDSYELPWYSYCYDTKTIVIESGVTGIGNSAFAKCRNLESVSIPASVTSIGNYAFEDCGSEATTAPTVSFAEGSTPLTIGERAFNYANLKSIDIPNRVTSIGERAFNSCSNLESVSIPASVTSIGLEAFNNCEMLAKVYIYAPSLTTYGAMAFAGNATGRKIYVLSEAVDTYKAGWSDYAADIEAMTLYATSVKEGTEDADKWTISPNPAPEGSPVTIQYTGRLKVKGVKATSEAAAPSVPDGALSGKFSVSSTKKVNFSKGNLRYASSKWSFFDNQYDYYESHSADAWDKFGWSTSATTYGMNTSTSHSTYSGDFVDWGATMGAGWFTLSSDEWTYLLDTRTVNGGTGDGNSYTVGQSVNGKPGLVIYPDNYTGEEYSGSDWATFESAGCVFLPAAGYRNGSSVSNAGTSGYYWSSSPSGSIYALMVYILSNDLYLALDSDRRNARSVRLVREVATTDAEPAKEPATVTTAPTGAAIVGVGKTTALVSGGAADGGELMYKVTTENTKPASTDGFSGTEPTAQDIIASGTVYVWYYVKAADDTHTDSEIAATPIVVPVADIIWDATNISDLAADGYGTSYEKEGVTMSANGGMIQAMWYNYGDAAHDGIGFNTNESGGFTFTAPTGKAFTKIEMNALGKGGWETANLGTGWAFNADMDKQIFTVTWTGSAASTVELLKGADEFGGETVNSIAFTLVDAE